MIDASLCPVVVREVTEAMARGSTGLMCVNFALSSFLAFLVVDSDIL